MLKDALAQLKTAIILFAFLSILTGLLYPLTITALSQLFFPKQANGSLIKQDDKIIGSLLIGQSFSSPEYFWGRPSATNPFPYNGAASLGSNYGPSNSVFLKIVQERINHIKTADPQNQQLIPVDLITASGSGLDPEISPLAAFYQASRVAKARQMDEKDVYLLIQSHIQPRFLGVLGEPRINVLQLNSALDNLRTGHGRPTPQS